ncbi:LamG domain-containing protein [Sulfurimonas sp.]|uniref:LamG domain-containing protein n=1 Tax=Sulfurimonas sp. TaxID=2022749 RepID=UPI002AB20AE6|nr:LamG domain-containing protein [Sulfurimonas sp.]
MKTFNTKFSFLLLLALFFIPLSALELSNDTFNSSTDGYTGTGVSASAGGWLVITKDNTATKTYNFGTLYANRTVTLNIRYRTSGGWENSGGSQDYFNTLVNGTNVKSYSPLDGTYAESFTATTDATGKIILAFNPNTTGAGEQVELDYVQINIEILNAEYRFDECYYDGSSNEVTDSIGSIHGVSYNGTSLDSNELILCSSASFDGVDDSISMGSNFNDIFGTTNDKFSVSAWIKPSSDDNSTSIIITKDNFKLQILANNKLNLSVKASSNISVNSAVSVRDNSWHFITATYNGSASPSLKLYVDGVEYADDVNATGNLQDASSDDFLLANGSYSGLIDEIKIFNTTLTSTFVNKIFTYEKAGFTYLLKSRVCQSCVPSYCRINGLGEGFHIVDPDGGDDSNSYEIYCDRTSTKAPRDLIALPLKNHYNNFVFKDDLPSSNYYTEADNSRINEAANSFNFLQISISGSTIKVIPSSVAEGSSNQGYFSNINLIGTPFSIDWTNTTLSNCDNGKLRKGAWNQAVKINTLDYTNGRCKVEQMQLKLLTNYKYLTFSDIMGTTNGSITGAYNSEILEETCRQIFQKVPDDATHLPTLGGASNGYFWVDPDKGGRVIGDLITTKFRPFVAYCKYQEDIKQAWTFVMALDAKVTNSKNDIKTMSQVRTHPNIYHDTCSQLGLLFFVPNTKDTFQRTRTYLFDNKSEWINYTGTIREKYKIYTNTPSKEYYIQGEGYNEIWPYGPFGLYFPQSGNHYADGRSLSWSNNNNMTGRCMNSGIASGASTCTDYTNSLLTPDDGTMGIMGWRTTLRDMIENNPTDPSLSAISDGNQWWIADVGAGNYLTNQNDGTPEFSVTAPGIGGGGTSVHRAPYYEPNGNYTQDAWLNFISDSNGNVYHNDDNNAFYSYYDYLCMSWDNYLGVSRYGLTEGPFTIIDRPNPAIDTSSGYPITTPSDLNITTKILNEAKNFDILLLSQNRAEIVDDQNISAGIFLTKIEQSEINGLPVTNVTDLKYYGQIGTNNNFNLAGNPRGVIALDNALSLVTSVHKRVVFQFKYCSYNNFWNTCWNITGSGTNTKATCTTGYDALGNPNSPCQVAESNDFAIRPNNFAIGSLDGIQSGGKLIVKAQDSNISYLANDFTGNIAPDYNVSFNNLDTDVTLINLGLNCSTDDLSDTNQSAYSFSNGRDSHTYTLSDVGEYSFRLQEVDGQEFALVDKDDTPDIDRFITPNAINLLIKPHHFNITTPPTNINHNSATGYTYLSNDLTNMAVTLNFRATAQNHLNAPTLNYSKDCYASNVNIDFAYTIPSGTLTLPNPIGKIIYKDFITTGAIDVNSTASLLKGGLLIPPTQVFTTDHNGSADFQIKFNFERDVNATKNPFVVNVNDLNVSDQTTVLQIGTDASHIIDVNATMFYGRAQGPKRAITKICHVTGPCITSASPDANNPRLIYQVYSDNPPLVPAFNNNGTGDIRWFANSWHREGNNDGLIGPVSEDAGFVTNGLGRSGGVFNFEYYLQYNGITYPYLADMKNTPDSWLIYDENNASATSNKFQVNFSKAGAWSGKAENNTTTTTKAKGITNRRTMW